VRILASNDPNRARLAADAERTARSIADESWKDRALEPVALALAATDPDRALRIAKSIKDEDTREAALMTIAQTLATAEPDHALRIAESITGEYSKTEAANRRGLGRIRCSNPNLASQLGASDMRCGRWVDHSRTCHCGLGKADGHDYLIRSRVEDIRPVRPGPFPQVRVHRVPEEDAWVRCRPISL